MLQGATQLFSKLVYVSVAVTTVALTCFAFRISGALSTALLVGALSVDILRAWLRRGHPSVWVVETQVLSRRNYVRELGAWIVAVLALYLLYHYFPGVASPLIDRWGPQFGRPFVKYMAMTAYGGGDKAQFVFLSEVASVIVGIALVFAFAIAESHPSLAKRFKYLAGRDRLLSWNAPIFVFVVFCFFIFMYNSLDISNPERKSGFAFNPQLSFLAELLVVVSSLSPAFFVRYWPTMYKRVKQVKIQKLETMRQDNV